MAINCLMRLIARGKAIKDQREVVGYVRIPEFCPREEITKILDIETGESIPVDPVSVEMFTGLRDARSGQRIFEGDVIQYYHAFDCEFKGYDDPEGEEPLCEVCMPLVLPKAGVRKQLYQHTTALMDGSCYCDASDMGETGHLWDAMDWITVGRADDKSFRSRYGEEVQVLYGEMKDGMGDEIFVPDEAMAGGACEKGGHIPVYDVQIGEGPRIRAVVPFFGTFKRRAHVLKRIFANPDYFRKHPELECKRKEWEPLYEAYVKAWE